MSAGDKDLFATMIKVENKDIFIDLRQNSSGVYLKLSERNGRNRNTVLIPASGIGRLRTVLEEVSQISSSNTRVSTERKNRIAGDPDVVNRSVYVSGLSWSTTDEELGDYFSEIGIVKKAVVLRKTRGGKIISLGCGVVEFVNPDDALRAVSDLNETELGGRTIKCREDRNVEDSMAAAPVSEVQNNSSSTEKGSRKRSTERKPEFVPTEERAVDPLKVFVTALAWATTSDDLLQFFSTVGGVVSAEVMQTRKGKSLGHAVVEFSSSDFAAEAIEKLNRKSLGGRTVVVRPYHN